MESILSFKHYDVLETIYRYNPTIDLETEDVMPELSLQVNYFDEQRTKAVLIFGIELGDPDLEENSFYIKAKVAGMFTLKVDESESTEFVDDMYRKNAVAILYPYMRSLVSDLSSKGSEEPIILPPINVAAMIEDNERITENYINT